MVAQLTTFQMQDEQSRKSLSKVIRNFWVEFSRLSFPHSLLVDMGVGSAGGEQKGLTMSVPPRDSDTFPVLSQTLDDLLSKVNSF